MRHVYSLTRVALWALVSAVMVGAGFAQQQSITNYVVVNAQNTSGTWWRYIYKADLMNTGPALLSANAVLTTSVPNIQVLANVLKFGPVSSNGQVTATNSFVISVDKSVPFKLTDLQWTFQVVLAPPPPVANAGASQTAVVGTTVTLDGSQSTNPSGIGTLTYSWALKSLPTGSTAKLVNPASVNPTFVPDVMGPFVIQLTVSNGKASGTATTTVNGDILPVANAGPNQSVTPGTVVILDGSKSSDSNGSLLTYSWAFTSIPPGSSAVLSGANTVSPSFTADKSGKYVVQLIVNDTLENSNPSSVTISQNAPPVANAGPNQTGITDGIIVQLDGSKSTDVDGDPITYKWSLITLPLNSQVALSNATIVNPTFTPDLAGTYIAQLIVNDGIYDSSASTVTINTIPKIQKPTANAGPNQRVIQHATVTLDGSASSDPQGLPLVYSWTFLDKPAGSTAVLSNPNAIGPTFTSDISGTYVIQLVVFNGTLASDPTTVLIAIDIPPVANAGPNQNVKLGTNVQLDGSGSIDSDGNGITYSWSLLSRPAGSTAVLSSPTAIKPTFTADVAGTYVAQLIVIDPLQSSTPSTVTITVVKKPTANAGPAQRVLPNTTVTLDGSASSDPQSLPLTYSWSFTSKPSGSTAVLSGNTTVNPTFTSDASGTYTLQLTVSNGPWISDPSTVTISIDTPPVANAGPNQNVIPGATVQLNGSASSDPDGDALSYSWSLITPPAGSLAALFSANTVGATFTADVIGTYVVQLVVNDGRQNSSPATVTITAAPPKIITLTPNPLYIPRGGTGTMTVTLAAPAGPSGQVVTLVSNNSATAKVPASVTIPANGTSVTISVTASVLTGTATITGSAPGFPSSSATVNVVAPTVTVTLDLPTVGLGGQVTGHVTLNVPAVSAMNVAISSNPTNIVTLPLSVPIPTGGTTASFTIAGAQLGNTTIRASVPGYASVTSLISVITEPLVNLPASLTVQAGQSVTLNVSLQNGAPSGGVTVNLTSADTTKVTVTPSVFIAAGATTPSTQPTITGLALGKINVSASAPGYASGGTNVTVTAGPPASITTGGTPQSVAINTVFAALTATVKDSFGNPVSGVPVTFTGPATPGAAGVTVAITTATTNSSGVATATLTANAIAGGPYSVTATANGLTANYSLTNLSVPPKSIAVSAGSGQSAQILTPFANPLQAIVKDSVNNPLANVVVTFTAPTGPGASGTFAGGGNTATAITDGTGVATSPVFTANGTVSSGTPYAVKVIVSGNASLSASFSMTNLSGPPTQIAATAGSGQSQTVNQTFGSALGGQLQATVRDAGGNLAIGVPVTFTAPPSGPSGTFAGGLLAVTVATNTSGVAIATAFTANGLAGAYTVTATFGGGPTTSFSLTNNAGPAALIVATAGTPQTGQINAAFATLQATVTDALGNPVSGATVNFTAPAGTGIPTGKFGASATASAVTKANGVASAPTFTANLLVGGPFTVTATVAGVSTPATFSLTNGPGAPSSLTAAAGTPQTIPAGLAPTTPLQVLVKDIGGNLLNNQTVTFTVNPGAGGQGGTFTGGATTATATTDSTGTATAPGFTANGTQGAYTVTATLNSLTATFALTNKAGLPAKIAPVPGTTPQSAQLTVNFTNALAVTVTDATNNPVSGVTVKFTAPTGSGIATGTFAGNLTTVTATTNASGVAQAPAFTPNLVLGSYSVTATSNSLSTSFALTNIPGPPNKMAATSGGGQSAQISTAFANPLVVTLTDVAGNPVSGAGVTFTAPSVGGSLTFAGGSKTATVPTNASGVATSPAMTANGTVSPGYAVTAALGAVSTTFTMTNTPGPPAHITATGGTPQSTPAGEPFAAPLAATVTDVGGNPVGGASVTFTAPTTSGSPSGYFGAPQTLTVTTNSSGVATTVVEANLVTGPYTVTATVAGVSTPATFVLTNTVCTACQSISMGNVSVGQFLQTQVAVNLSKAPSGTTSVTITSSDPTKVLVSGRSADPGVASLAVPFAPGITQVSVFVQGVASSGSAYLIASAPGYVFGVSNVTLTPSGFVLTIPSQPSSNTLVTANGGSTPMVLQSSQLDSSLNPIGFQQIAGGLTANVTLQNSSPTVGKVSLTSPVAVTGANDPVNFTFTADPSNTGVTTLTAAVPTGFSAPASGNIVTVHVSAAQLGVSQTDATIGQNLQTSAQVLFSGGGTQAADTLFTITSSDSTKLLLATSPTAVGASSITVKIPAGFSKSANFFIQSLANSGSVNYTVQATGFPTLTKAAILAPSGILVSGPAGLGNQLKTTTQSPASTITVVSFVLDSTNNPVSQQAVAGGLTVTSSITSSDLTIGTISVSPVTLAANTSSTTTQFQPVNTSAGGTLTISASVPTGFSTPAADGSVSVLVSEPGMSFAANGSTIGNNLQIQDAIVLGAPAPAGGLVVTVTSNSPNLMLAVNPTDAGTASITFTVPAGNTGFPYFLQALANSGTATYTANAASFTSKTGTVTLGNSGVALAGPLGLGAPIFSTLLSSGPSTWSVYTVLLDGSNKFVASQSLRSGVTVTADLTSSNTAVATIGTPVTINGGGPDHVTTTFTPLTTGSTSVTLAQPSNLGLAANSSKVNVLVQ